MNRHVRLGGVSQADGDTQHYNINNERFHTAGWVRVSTDDIHSPCSARIRKAQGSTRRKRAMSPHNLPSVENPHSVSLRRRIRAPWITTVQQRQDIFFSRGI